MIKLTHINYWFMLLLLLGFAACSDDNDNEELSLKSKLNVSTPALRFSSNKADTVFIDYAGSWNAKLSDDSWCTLDKTSGKGKGMIVVTPKSRNDAEMKSAKLIVQATDRFSEIQVINLLLNEIKFYTDPIAVDFGYGDNTKHSINVVCEGEWTATLDDESWCSIDKRSGNGEEQITLTSHFDLDNLGDKHVTLTITSKEDLGLKTTVEIKQVREFIHGSCITLNKATKGKGIDFVILGDGFTKESMGLEGHWHKHMQLAMEGIFKYEPLASFKEYCNVYAVTAVSASNIIKGGEVSNTFFGAHFTSKDGGFLSTRSEAEVSDFAYTHSPVIKEKGTPKDMFVLLLVNTTKYGGISILNGENANFCSGIGINTLYDGSGSSIYQPREDFYQPLLVHEFIGHGFGKLVDEYIQGSAQRIPEKEKEQSIQRKKTFGIGQNIEYTNDPAQFDNKYWQKLLEIKYPGVEVFEGAAHYSFGAWRSNESDLMRDTFGSPFFSPVNREIILRQIYKLAGMEDEYSLDVFLEYDKKNL